MTKTHNVKVHRGFPSILDDPSSPPVRFEAYCSCGWVHSTLSQPKGETPHELAASWLRLSESAIQLVITQGRLHMIDRHGIAVRL